MGGRKILHGLQCYFCLQEKPFRLTRTLLFDGEMGLQSKKAQTEIQKRFGLEVYAQPGFKRLLAERAIREVKLRTAICLQLKGRVFFKSILGLSISRKKGG